MNSLFMELSENKQFSTRVSLLRALDISNQPLSIKELSHSLGVSTPTIRSEIKNLNQEFSNYLTIVTPTNGTASLQIRRNTSCHTVLSLLTKGTLMFKVLYSIFHNENLTYDEAAKHFNFSRSTITRVSKQIESTLKKFHLSLEKNRIAISGKEEDIRTFFFELSCQSGNYHLFSETASDDAKRFLRFIERGNIEKIRYNFYRISIWISVLRVRWKHGFFHEPDDYVMQIAERSVGFPCFQEAVQNTSFRFKLPQALPYHELCYAFITSLHCVSYSNVSSSFEQWKKYSYFTADALPECANLHEVIFRLVPNTTRYHELFIKLEGYLINAITLTKISKHLTLLPKEAKIYTAEMYPDEFAQNFAILQNFFNSIENYGKPWVEDVSCVITNMLLAHESSVMRPLKVLFAIQGPPGYDEYIMETSKKYFHGEMTVDYHFERHLPMEDIHLFTPDLLISNYCLPIERELPCLHYRFTQFPLKHDWEVFSLFLEKFVNGDLVKNNYA